MSLNYSPLATSNGRRLKAQTSHSVNRDWLTAGGVAHCQPANCIEHLVQGEIGRNG